MNFLLSSNFVDPNRPTWSGGTTGFEKVKDVFIDGGKWFLLGMLAVFAVLGLIWVAIELFHRFCMLIAPPKKSNAPKNAPTTAPAAPATAVTAPVAAAPADEEIVAVIIAAIEAAKADTPNGKFRVVSFRKK